MDIAALLLPYDLTVSTVSRLDGYASINYKLTTAEGTFVLKHYQDPSEYDLIRAEDLLLSQVKHLVAFAVPGAAFPLQKLEDGTFTRVIPFIKGQLLADANRSDALLFNLGGCIARLHLAWQEMRSAPVEARKLFWDMEYTLLNLPKMGFITDPRDRKLVHYFYDLFAHHILPRQNGLRHSLLHGDLNDNNILVEGDLVTGFIDFGDLTYSPLIYEVAIALAYIILAEPEQPFEKAAHVLKGFHQQVPLTREEVQLLYYLIPARLCVSVCNSAEAKSRGVDTEYILISERPAWNFLQRWISINPLWLNHFFCQQLGLPFEFPDIDQLLAQRTRLAGKSLGLSYTSPIYLTGGAFQYLYDQTGNTYLDAYNNIPQVGHAHPRTVQCLSNQVRTLNTNTRYLYLEWVRCAEMLTERLPTQLCKVFFVNSGSAASDVAIRMARLHTERHSIAILEHGYHGNSISGIDISSYKFDGKGGPGKPDHIISLPLPNLYRGKFSNAQAYVDDAIQTLSHEIGQGNYPAAFIAEPISGCGGQVPLPPGYLPQLQAFLEQHRVLTILDEVQTGFGRLGSHYWGFEMQGVVPDILVLGKPMGNGHPVAAVVTTEAIADSFANGMEFFSSFGGNPVSCAVASEVMAIISDEGLQENAKVVGAYLLDKLRALQSLHPQIGDVRGQGLFIGVEFVNLEGHPHARLAEEVKEAMKARFILLGTDGPDQNVIKIKPPLCFNTANATHLVEQLGQVLRELNP